MFRFRTPDRAKLVVSAVALVAAIAGSPLASADTVTITFANRAAAEGTTKPAIDKVTAGFEATHPDTRIKSEAFFPSPRSRGSSRLACARATRPTSRNSPATTRS